MPMVAGENILVFAYVKKRNSESILLLIGDNLIAIYIG
jgi:hypothetical protein